MVANLQITKRSLSVVLTLFLVILFASQFIARMPNSVGGGEVYYKAYHFLDMATYRLSQQIADHHIMLCDDCTVAINALSNLDSSIAAFGVSWRIPDEWFVKVHIAEHDSCWFCSIHIISSRRDPISEIFPIGYVKVGKNFVEQERGVIGPIPTHRPNQILGRRT